MSSCALVFFCLAWSNFFADNSTLGVLWQQMSGISVRAMQYLDNVFHFLRSLYRSFLESYAILLTALFVDHKIIGVLCNCVKAAHQRRCIFSSRKLSNLNAVSSEVNAYVSVGVNHLASPRWSPSIYHGVRELRKSMYTGRRKKSKKTDIYLESSLSIAFTFARVSSHILPATKSSCCSFFGTVRRYIIICRTMAKCNCRTSFIERLYRPRVASSVPDGISVSELSIPSHMDGESGAPRARLESLITFTNRAVLLREIRVRSCVSCDRAFFY